MLHRGLKWDPAPRGDTSYLVHSIPPSIDERHKDFIQSGGGNVPAASTYKWMKTPYVWGEIDHQQMKMGYLQSRHQ